MMAWTPSSAAARLAHDPKHSGPARAPRAPTHGTPAPSGRLTPLFRRGRRQSLRGFAISKVLEDNDERVRQFHAAAAEIAPDVPIRIWRSAHAMITAPEIPPLGSSGSAV